MTNKKTDERSEQERPETPEERGARLEPRNHKKDEQKTKEVTAPVSIEDGTIIRDLIRDFDSASGPAGQPAESAIIRKAKDGYELVWTVPVTPDEEAFAEAQARGQDTQDKNSNLDQSGTEGKPDESKKTASTGKR